MTDTKPAGIDKLCPDDWVTEARVKLPSLIDRADDLSARFGEGISRTSDPSALLYPVEIPLINAPTVRATIRATSPKQARLFAANNHPNADASRITVGKPLKAF
jgi:hypothetical protein